MLTALLIVIILIEFSVLIALLYGISTLLEVTRAPKPPVQEPLFETPVQRVVLMDAKHERNIQSIIEEEGSL